MEAAEKFVLFDKKLNEENKPSLFFHALSQRGEFPAEYPFSLLADLKDIPQSPVYHPEGSVLNHTMMVVDAAAVRRHLSSNARVFMWAALLHDLGKAKTTRIRRGRITSYDHDIEGEKLARGFLEACTGEKVFISHVCALVRWHMQPMFVLKNMPFADLKGMKAKADPKEVALLYLCDRLGRGGLTKDDMQKEINGAEEFLLLCGYKGDWKL